MKQNITVYIITAMLLRTVYDTVQDRTCEYRYRGILQITTDKQKAEDWNNMYQDIKARLTVKQMDSTALTVLLEDNRDNWNYNRKEFQDLRALFAA